MTMEPDTWCDPDAVGAPLPQTDEVDTEPQSVTISPRESFEVLRQVSEDELRAQERGEQLDPMESGRAAITIALTPLCQLEGAVLVGVSLLEGAVRRVERVDEENAEVYLPDWLYGRDSLRADEVAGLLVERVERDLSDPVVVSTMGEEAVAQLRAGLSVISAARREDVDGFAGLVRPDADPEWLVDGAQEICVALAAHAATIGWERPEVDVSAVFASLELGAEPDLVRDLLRRAGRS